MRRRRLLSLARAAMVGLLVGCWLHAWQVALAADGLFRWLGIDFGLAWSWAALLRSAGGAALYDLQALGAKLQALAVYTAAPGEPLRLGPVPYPPVVAWALGPLTRLPAPVAFGVWTAINVLAAVHLARRAAQFFPERRRLFAAALVLTSFPLGYCLFVGEPYILLACALGEAYLSLQAGLDLRAGLWISLLLVKPQYGILLGPLLIWKRRWLSVAGVALGGLGLLVLSLWGAGLQALLTVPRALRAAGDSFQGQGMLVYANQMINWRGLILRLAPNVDGSLGFALALLLGLATAGLALRAWRGPWQPEAAGFPERMTLLLLATLLANYHSHVHGAVLLAVPLAQVAAERWSSRLVRLTTWTLLLAPTLAFVAVGNMILAAWLLMLPLLALFGWLSRPRPRPALAGGAPAHKAVPRPAPVWPPTPAARRSA